MWLATTQKPNLLRFYYKYRIFIAEFFWQCRIFLALIIFKNNNTNLKCIKDLKNNGVTVLSGYLNATEIDLINNECDKVLDNTDNLDQFSVEKIEGSIKVKDLGRKINFFNKMQNNFFLKIIAFIYMFKFKTLRRGALMIYSLTHDGCYKHSSVPGSFSGEMLAGNPHIDSPFHGIKAFIALEDIKMENGPFTSIKNSSYNELLLNHYTNMLLGIKHSETINKELLISIIKSNETFYSLVKKGDLVITDTRNIHFASSLKKGIRKLLWYYY